jgi:hypothetical protein
LRIASGRARATSKPRSHQDYRVPPFQEPLRTSSPHHRSRAAGGRRLISAPWPSLGRPRSNAGRPQSWPQPAAVITTTHLRWPLVTTAIDPRWPPTFVATWPRATGAARGCGHSGPSSRTQSWPSAPPSSMTEERHESARLPYSPLSAALASWPVDACVPDDMWLRRQSQKLISNYSRAPW